MGKINLIQSQNLLDANGISRANHYTITLCCDDDRHSLQNKRIAVKCPLPSFLYSTIKSIDIHSELNLSSLHGNRLSRLQ